ncbi:MAG: LEA type 2 family protein [Desulfobacterales bacterium]
MGLRKKGAAFRWWPTVALAMMLTGCAAMGWWREPPRISLASIRIMEVRGFETAFEVDLRVFNRTDRPLLIRGIDCELELNGKRFAEGVANPQKEIPPFESDIVTATVYTSMLDMFTALHRVIQGTADPDRMPTYTYSLKGWLRAGSPGFSTAIPFRSEGRLDFGGQSDAKP